MHFYSSQLSFLLKATNPIDQVVAKIELVFMVGFALCESHGGVFLFHCV